MAIAARAILIALEELNEVEMAEGGPEIALRQWASEADTEGMKL